jgi:hypothetical protein
MPRIDPKVDAKAATAIIKKPQTAARFLQSIFLQSIAFLMALTRADKKGTAE